MSAITDPGARWRIVTVQDGTEHVSSGVYAPQEIPEQLAIEADMHEGTGWYVERVTDAGRLVAVLARRGETARAIGARVYGPLDDPGGGD